MLVLKANPTNPRGSKLQVTFQELQTRKIKSWHHAKPYLCPLVQPGSRYATAAAGCQPRFLQATCAVLGRAWSLACSSTSPVPGTARSLTKGLVAWRGWARSSAGASRGTLAPLYMSTADAINYLNDYSLFLQSLPHYSTSTSQQ